MSIFQCQKCGCAENTSSGRYHSRHRDVWAEDNRGLALCQECAPTHYGNGEPVREKLREREHEKCYYPKGMFVTDREGNLAHKDTLEAAYRTGLGRKVEWEEGKTGSDGE